MSPLSETSLGLPGQEFGGDTLLRFANLRSWLSQTDPTAPKRNVNVNSKPRAAIPANGLVKAATA